MRRAFATIILSLVTGLSLIPATADPKKAGGAPPGLEKRSGVPPGLAKKGGLPPGIAKKYKVGEFMPPGEYLPIEAHYRAKLPYGSPAGKQWVRVGRDLYLLTTATGTIADVIENWLN
jgi:hypothetical protein